MARIAPSIVLITTLTFNFVAGSKVHVYFSDVHASGTTVLANHDGVTTRRHCAYLCSAEQNCAGANHDEITQSCQLLSDPLTGFVKETGQISILGNKGTGKISVKDN